MSDLTAGVRPQVWSHAASAVALARAGWRRFVAALQASRRREAAMLLQRHRDLIAPASAPDMRAADRQVRSSDRHDPGLASQALG